MLIDILGWIAVITLLPSSWFQIFKNFRRKSTAGLSILTSLSIFIGLALLLIVSLARPTPLQVIIQFAVASLGWGIILVQMAIYKKSSSS